VQRGNDVGSIFRELTRFVKRLFIQGQRTLEEALKTGSNILTDEISKQPEQSVGDNLKTGFGAAKINDE